MNDKDKILHKVSNIFDRTFSLIEEKIIVLPYFNGANFKINKDDFKVNLLDDPISYNGFEIAKALYNGVSNTLYLFPYMEHLDTYMLHEIIHMASSNRNERIVGYCDVTSHRLFNEAATEYLVEKVKGIHYDYIELVDILKEYIGKYGEDKMYYGFFEANFSKFYNNFNEEEREDIDIMIEKMNKYRNIYCPNIEKIRERNA